MAASLSKLDTYIASASETEFLHQLQAITELCRLHFSLWLHYSYKKRLLLEGDGQIDRFIGFDLTFSSLLVCRFGRQAMHV